MVRRRSLDSSFLPHFRQLLLEGLAFGPPLAKLVDLAEGCLSVWAPEDVETIRPEKLPMDIFYPLPYNSTHDISEYLASVMNEAAPWLLLGETYRFVTEKPSAEDTKRFVWPVVASAVPAYDKFLCVCSVESSIDEQQWDAFSKELKGYPSIVLIAKPPNDLDLKRGEFPELAGEQLSNLLRSAQYILVGVFDELSMMLWEKAQKPAAT